MTDIKVDPEAQGQIFTITNGLRFVERDGKKILQQMWQGSSGTQEWHDVPVEEE